MSDISKHPLIKQSYEVGLAIEACGASEALTNASVKASALTEALDDYLSNHKNDWNTETLAILDRAIARADKALPEAQPTSPEREWLREYWAKTRGVDIDDTCVNQDFTADILAAYRRHVLADAIEAVEAEKVAADETDEESDYAYNRAVDDCANRLRDMKEK